MWKRAEERRGDDGTDGLSRERISEMRVIAGVKWKHVPRTSKVALGGMVVVCWCVVVKVVVGFQLRLTS